MRADPVRRRPRPADLAPRHPGRHHRASRGWATARRSATTARPPTTPSAARRPWAAWSSSSRPWSATSRPSSSPRASRRASALLLLFLFVGLGVVGFLDDFIKISRQRSLGLRSSAKMIGQTVVALVFGVLALSPELEDDRGNTPASTHISFIRDIEWLALPTVVALVLIWVIVTGTSNAVNLTDGLDGLATGASILVFGAYTLVNIWQNNQSCATAGGRHLLRGARPARPRGRRGGDHRRLLRLPVVERLTGGDLHGRHRLAGARRRAGRAGDPDPHRAAAADHRRAVRRGHPVGDDPGRVLQGSRRFGFVRSVFRVGPGHRVFRIAPLHHHFEMLGWEQVTVVIRFWIITGLCVAAGLGVFYAQWVAGA